MPYIGRSENFGVRSRFQYQATASQTSFSGSDANSLSLSYTDSLYMDVYQNGVLLVPADRDWETYFLHQNFLSDLCMALLTLQCCHFCFKCIYLC